MNLKNGYKTLYEVVKKGKRIFLATKTGVFADAEEIASFDIGTYKSVYETPEGLFGRTDEGDVRLDVFDKVFVEATESEDTVEPDNGEDEGTDEPVVDPTDEPQDPEDTEPEEEPGDEPEQIPESTEGEEEPTVDETEA